MASSSAATVEAWRRANVMPKAEILDPQGQANKWIKEMQKKRSLKVEDLKSKNFLRELETAITYGLPYLLQDVEEELDREGVGGLIRIGIERGAITTMPKGHR